MEHADPQDLDHLIACPHCDALYHVGAVQKGEQANCVRCHSELIAPRRDAGLKIIALAMASVTLVIAALFLPFLEISRLGFSNGATLVGTALVFSEGPLFLLSLAAVAMIIALPLARLLLTIFTIAPLVFDRPALPGAKRAFRLSEALKPWAMAEIFVIGCAVSLVKLSDLARVEFGPAFWMFCGLVILTVIQDTLVCRWSVWKALER